MFKKLIILSLPLLVVFCPQEIFSRTLKTQQVVIFGDSYSDNGNTYRRSKNTYPGRAYYLGHFSNGPNWSEYLSIQLGISPQNPLLFRNYAYGQAQISGKISLETHSLTNKWSFVIPDLSGQIDEYIKEGHIKPNESLYFIFIGTNDLLNYKPTSHKQNSTFISQKFLVLKQQVNRLKKIGASKIVLFKWRDLKRYPLSRQLAQKYGNNYLDTLDKMISKFNKIIANEYNKDPTIYIYDTYGFDTAINNSYRSYQWNKQNIDLKDKITPCYQHGGNYIELIERKYCQTPWSYWFFDRIHPTTYVDYLMSQKIYSFLNKNHLR